MTSKQVNLNAMSRSQLIEIICALQQRERDLVARHTKSERKFKKKLESVKRDYENRLDEQRHEFKLQLEQSEEIIKSQRKELKKIEHQAQKNIEDANKKVASYVNHANRQVERMYSQANSILARLAYLSEVVFCETTPIKKVEPPHLDMEVSGEDLGLRFDETKSEMRSLNLDDLHLSPLPSKSSMKRRGKPRRQSSHDPSMDISVDGGVVRFSPDSMHMDEPRIDSPAVSLNVPSVEEMTRSRKLNAELGKGGVRNGANVDDAFARATAVNMPSNGMPPQGMGQMPAMPNMSGIANGIGMPGVPGMPAMPTMPQSANVAGMPHPMYGSNPMGFPPPGFGAELTPEELAAMGMPLPNTANGDQMIADDAYEDLDEGLGEADALMAGGEPVNSAEALLEEFEQLSDEGIINNGSTFDKPINNTLNNEINNGQLVLPEINPFNFTISSKTINMNPGVANGNAANGISAAPGDQVLKYGPLPTTAPISGIPSPGNPLPIGSPIPAVGFRPMIVDQGAMPQSAMPIGAGPVAGNGAIPAQQAGVPINGAMDANSALPIQPASGMQPAQGAMGDPMQGGMTQPTATQDGQAQGAQIQDGQVPAANGQAPAADQQS